MTDISRRFFLGGALALTVAAALPIPALAAVPTIYADGIHDDAPGLNALFAGMPVNISGHAGARVFVEGELIGGNFRIGSTVIMHRDNFLVEGNTFTALPELGANYMMDIRYSHGSMFINNAFFGNGFRATSLRLVQS